MSSLIVEPSPQGGSIALHLPERLSWDDAALFEFCVANKELCIERDADGTIHVMHPDGSFSSSGAAEIVADLTNWARLHGGRVLGADGGVWLANRAMRAPDAAWVSDERWARYRAQGNGGFLNGCPEFLVEVLSKSDSLPRTQLKMQEWIANGTQLAWLVDPFRRLVWVYENDGSEAQHEAPTELSGGVVLPGLVVRFDRVWT